MKHIKGSTDSGFSVEHQRIFKMPRERTLSGDVKRCIRAVHDYFQDEYRRGKPRLAVHRVLDRVAAALSVSKASVINVVKPSDSKGPERKIPRRKRPTSYYSFTMAVIRRRMHRF